MLKNLTNISIFALLICLMSCSGFQGSGKNSVNIGFVGDMIPHMAIRKSAKLHPDGYDYIFSEVKEDLSAPDFMSGNMEFSMKPPFISNGLYFNSTPDMLDTFKKTGFDILALSNNHMHDNGDEGIEYTMSILEKKSIPFIGVNRTEKDARKGIVFEKNGIRIGMTAYTTLMNYGFPSKNPIFHINNSNKIRKTIKEIGDLKKRCDYLVVQVHTGVEYVTAPTSYDEINMKKFLEAGADLIIAHHPHVLQYVEQYKTSDGRECTIFYSLGNFLAHQTRNIKIKNSRYRVGLDDSIIVNVELFWDGAKIDNIVHITPVHIDKEIKKSGKHKFKHFQIIPLKDKIKELENSIAKSSSIKEKNRLNKKLSNYRYRLKAIEAALFQKEKPENFNFIK